MSKTRDEKMGGTSSIDGLVLYQGSRDELQMKLRQKDDYIDELRKQIEELENKVKNLEEHIYDLKVR